MEKTKTRLAICLAAVCVIISLLGGCSCPTLLCSDGIAVYSQSFFYTPERTREQWLEAEIELVEIDTDLTAHDYYDGSFSEHITVVARVEDNATLYREMRSILMFEPLGDPHFSIRGCAVRISYPDGSVEIVSEDGQAFIEDGKIIFSDFSFTHDSSFDSLWERWTQPS